MKRPTERFDVKDVRIGTYRRAKHIPTGVVVEIEEGIGQGSFPQLLDKLQIAVDEYLDNELAKLP